VAAAISPTRCRAGHNQNISSLLSRGGRSDECAASFWRFDDNDRQ
jgi:hypothetical protein